MGMAMTITRSCDDGPMVVATWRRGDQRDM